MRAAVICIVILCLCAPLGHSLRAAPAEENASIVMVIDISGSMLETDPGRLALESAKLFVDMLSPGDDIALVFFNHTIMPQSTNLVALTAAQARDKEQLKSRISSIQYQGNTQTLSALNYALSLLGSARSGGGRRRAIVLLTDGQDEGCMDMQGQIQVKSCGDRYRQFLTQARRADVQIFPIAIGGALGFKEILNQVTDEPQALIVEKPEDLPEKFTYVYGRIFDTLVRPLRQNGNDYAFDVHELSREVDVIMAGDFGSDFSGFRVEDPGGKSYDRAGLNQSAGYAGSSQNYVTLKFNGPVHGQNWALRSTAIPKRASIIQRPDISVQVTWGDFVLLNKEIIAKDVVLLTDSGRKPYKNPDFYKDAHLFLVIKPASGEAYRSELVRGDDFHFSGRDYLRGFGGFIYYVELQHPDFGKRSPARFVAVNEKVELTAPAQRQDLLTVPQGDVASFPLSASSEVKFGTRDEVFYADLKRGSEPGWDTFTFKPVRVTLSKDKPVADIPIPTSAGNIWLFGYGATPPGKYRGQLTISYAGTPPVDIPLEINVTPNPWLRLYSVAFYALLLFALWLFISTVRAKKFPRGLMWKELRAGSQTQGIARMGLPGRDASFQGFPGIRLQPGDRENRLHVFEQSARRLPDSKQPRPRTLTIGSQVLAKNGGIWTMGRTRAELETLGKRVRQNPEAVERMRAARDEIIIE